MEKITITIKPWQLILSATILALALVSATFMILALSQSRPVYLTVDQQKTDALFNNLAVLAKKKALGKPVAFQDDNSGFGWRRNPIRRFIGGLIVGYHAGVDLAATNGTPIAASGDGVIIGLGRCLVGGRYLVVDYGDGVTMTYYHLSRLNFKSFKVTGWNIVSKKQVIAFTGNTGITTGAHLHVQVEYNGVPTNPYFWFQIAD